LDSHVLIFFRLRGPLSDRIRHLDGGVFSHVALSLGGDDILEAAPPQVRIGSLLARTREADHIGVYQLHRPLVRPISNIIRTPYDWNWLAGKDANHPEYLHCATLIGHLFDLVGPRHPNLSLSELIAFCGREG